MNDKKNAVKECRERGRFEMLILFQPRGIRSFDEGIKIPRLPEINTLHINTDKGRRC